jgi:hypothetical protein
MLLHRRSFVSCPCCGGNGIVSSGPGSDIAVGSGGDLSAGPDLTPMSALPYLLTGIVILGLTLWLFWRRAER